MLKESLKAPLFTDGFHLSDLLCQSYPPTHSVFMKNTSGMAVEMECFRPLAHWPFASAHDGFGKRNSVRPESVHVTISRSDSLCSDADTSSVSDRAVGPGTKSRHMAGTQERDGTPTRGRCGCSPLWFPLRCGALLCRVQPRWAARHTSVFLPCCIPSSRAALCSQDSPSVWLGARTPRPAAHPLHPPWGRRALSTPVPAPLCFPLPFPLRCGALFCRVHPRFVRWGQEARTDAQCGWGGGRPRVAWHHRNGAMM